MICPNPRCLRDDAHTHVMLETSSLSSTIGAVIETKAASLTPTYGPPSEPAWLRAARSESQRPDPRRECM